MCLHSLEVPLPHGPPNGHAKNQFLNGSGWSIIITFYQQMFKKTNILTWFERAIPLKAVQNDTPKINFFVCRKQES